MKVQTDNSVQVQEGNSSKPLLCDVYSLKGIELKGKFKEVFNETIVEEALVKIDEIFDKSLLLGVEEYQIKMRLFLKLKQEMEILHTLNQSSNFFTEGSWNYTGESLSRRG